MFRFDFLADKVNGAHEQHQDQKREVNNACIDILDRSANAAREAQLSTFGA